VKNVIYERFKFLTGIRKEGEEYEQWVVELKRLLSTYEFEGETKSQLCLMIVIGINDKSLQEKLLRTPKLDVKMCHEIVMTRKVHQPQEDVDVDQAHYQDVDKRSNK